MTLQQDIKADTWTVAGRTFSSRLIVGTGKYKSLEENAAAVEASGAEIVTVAVRRVNISDPNQPRLTDFIGSLHRLHTPHPPATSGDFARLCTPRTALMTPFSLCSSIFVSTS